jgi:hypothetical protein
LINYTFPSYLLTRIEFPALEIFSIISSSKSPNQISVNDEDLVSFFKITRSIKLFSLQFSLPSKKFILVNYFRIQTTTNYFSYAFDDKEDRKESKLIISNNNQQMRAITTTTTTATITINTNNKDSIMYTVFVRNKNYTVMKILETLLNTINQNINKKNYIGTKKMLL